MQLKLENPTLAEEYYDRSVRDLDNMGNLHDDVVKIINVTKCELTKHFELGCE